MEVENATAVSAEREKAIRLRALLDKVLPAARAADAVARRLVGKVRTLSLLGLGFGVWLTYVCEQRFDLSMAALLPIAAAILTAPLVLLKIAGMLGSVVGLPNRIVDAVNRVVGKAQEYRQLATSSPTETERRKPTLRTLWGTGRSFMEIKGFADESREIVALAGSALAIGNPVFAIVLGIAGAVTTVVIVIGAIVGLASF